MIDGHSGFNLNGNKTNNFFVITLRVIGGRVSNVEVINFVVGVNVTFRVDNGDRVILNIGEFTTQIIVILNKIFVSVLLGKNSVTVGVNLLSVISRDITQISFLGVNGFFVSLLIEVYHLT